MYSKSSACPDEALWHKILADPVVIEMCRFPGRCNKVTCTQCGNHMCWLCGKAITGYNHFDTGQCALFYVVMEAPLHLRERVVPEVTIHVINSVHGKMKPVNTCICYMNLRQYL